MEEGKERKDDRVRRKVRYRAARLCFYFGFFLAGIGASCLYLDHLKGAALFLGLGYALTLAGYLSSRGGKDDGEDLPEDPDPSS